VELAKAKGFEFATRLASFLVTGVKNTLSLMRPPIDEQRLARECMGIARCNKVGKAFSGTWKAPERRSGEEGARFGGGAAAPKQAIAAKPVQAPAQPLVTITAPKHTEPNYNAWPNHQEYLDAVTKDVPTMVACHLKVSHIRMPAHAEGQTRMTNHEWGSERHAPTPFFTPSCSSA
jgi:hypothetical protein